MVVTMMVLTMMVIGCNDNRSNNDVAKNDDEWW